MAQSTASKETQNEPKKRTRKVASGDGQAPAQAEKPAGKRAASSKSADDKKAPAAKKTAGSRAKKSDGAAAKKPRAKKGAAQDGPSREDIERRAYELYERRGGEHGLHDDDWLEAERQLREEAGS
jgi:hypothetical protein